MMRTSITVNRLRDADGSISRFARQLPDNFARMGTVVHSARNEVRLCTVRLASGRLLSVAVKRYKLPNPVQRVAYGCLRATKAARAYRNAQALRSRGFDTPEALACVETRSGLMLGHCYFVSDADSRPPVSVLMADGRPADALLARSLAAFALSLHRRGILHNDFNSGNVLFGRAADGSYRFSLIDINRADIYPDRVCPSATLRAEELTRLTPDLRLYAAVARHYADLAGPDWPLSAREMLAVKRRHDTARRRRKALFATLRRWQARLAEALSPDGRRKAMMRG